MKRRFLFVLIIGITFCVVSLSNAEKVRRLKSVDNAQTVYTDMANGIYHLKDCSLIKGKSMATMTLGRAKERGFKPCESCFYEEVEVLANQPAISNREATKSIAPSAASSKVMGSFRDIQWGTNKGQVQKIEKSEFIKSDKSNEGLDYLAYKSSAAGMPCLISYYFAENQLVAGRYIFLSEHSNKNLYINDYDDIKESLIKKYGQPNVDRPVWNNDLYKNDPSEWGMAISVGHLSYTAGWQLANTQIILHLGGDNYDITLGLDYHSTLKSHEDLRTKAKEKAESGIW